MTRDGGKNWERVTPPDLPEFARISLIEASPHQNGVAYLAGQPLPAGRSQALRLQDRGLRQDVDEDRHRHSRRPTSRASFARTRSAAGCSTPAPSTASTSRSTTAPSWQSLRLNLPVDAGARHRRRRSATSSSARTAAASTCSTTSTCCARRRRRLTSSALHVFQPNNPLRGLDNNIAFDYYLARSADEVKIEFLDAQGTVLRTFTGTPKAAPPAAGRRRRRSSAAPPPRVGTRKGMNRFTWDLRRRAPSVFPGHDHVGGAAAARPGVAAGQVHACASPPTARPRRATSPSASIRGSRPTASPKRTCWSSSSCRSQVRDA